MTCEQRKPGRNSESERSPLTIDGLFRTVSVEDSSPTDIKCERVADDESASKAKAGSRSETPTPDLKKAAKAFLKSDMAVPVAAFVIGAAIKYFQKR